MASVDRVPIIGIASAIVFLSLLAGDVTSLTGPSHDRVVVCYIATWAAYRQNEGAFTIDDLDPSLCTHLVYSFAGLNASGSSIRVLDAWQDLKDDYGKGGYEKATGLKSRYPHLKVTLAIGGWNEGSVNYSKLAENPTRRQIFINSVVAILKKYNFDGLDLDWEYPGKRGGSPQDKQNFVTLVKELKTEFRKHNFILTAALGASKETIDVSYDVVELSKYLDLIHMMCYDYHGTWDGIVGSNSPLYGEQDGDVLSVQYTINYMLQMGAPPEKLVMGLPLYGRTFLRDTTFETGPNAGSSSAPVLGITKVQPAGFQGPYTKEAGFMGYHEICLELSNKSSGWGQMWDDRTKTAYAFNGDKFITYDSQRSIAAKIQFAIDKKLRGLMVWSIDTDDFRGNCPPETDIYKEYHSSLKKVQMNPFFNEILPSLNIKRATEEDFKRLNESTAKSEYVIQNDKVILLIPKKSNDNFPLMRTIEQAVGLAQKEEMIVKMIEEKIKEKERENEISDTPRKPNSATSNNARYIDVLFLSMFGIILGNSFGFASFTN